MNKDSEIKLFIGENEASSEELAHHFSSLLHKKSGGKEAEHLARVLELVTEFHELKHKQPLYDAVRNEPELFESKIFREFVADVLEGLYTPKSGTISKHRLEINHRILATIEYFKNMGLPSHFESKSGKLCASHLTADRLNLSVHKVQDELKTKNKNKTSEFGSSALVSKDLLSSDGTVIWVLNGFRAPSSEAEIAELESIYLSLAVSESKEIRRFCEGFVAHECTPPRTQDRLNEIEELLAKREGYELIQRHQRRKLSLQGGF